MENKEQTDSNEREGRIMGGKGDGPSGNMYEGPMDKDNGSGAED